MNVQLPRDRFEEILVAPDRPNDWRYKLEQSCIGRIILTIFCCSYYDSCFKDPHRRDWNRHRIYLLNNRPEQPGEDYDRWERAVVRVNRNLPFHRIDPNYRRVHYEQPFFQQPRPVHRPEVEVNPFFVPSLNNFGNHRPVSVVAPQPAPLILNANPTFNGGHRVYPQGLGQRQEGNRPTSVNPRALGHGNVAQPVQQPQAINHRPGSVPPGMKRR